MGLTFEINTAYGWIGIGLVLSVGLVLLVIRPYWAFLFAVFVLTATSINVGIMRTEELGAYFNVSDACILVMIIASLLGKKRAMLIPAPFVNLTAVLIMGFVIVLFYVKTHADLYDALRGLRYGITLPLLIFLTANLVQDKDKVRSLLVTLFLAAIVAEAQHLYLVLAAKSVSEEDVDIRTMQFIRAGSELWLVAGFYVVRGSIPRRRVQMAIGVLFLAGLMALQTRSVGLAFLGALVFYYLWFLKGPHAYRWQRFKGLIPIFILGLIMLAVMGLTAVISGYAERYATTLKTGEGTESRWNAMQAEIHDWLDGNPIIGRGLGYFAMGKFRGGIHKLGVAYGHLGYVTYLSQLGLIGFLVYAFWLPLVILLRARLLLQQPHAPPEVVYLAALTGATFIYYPLMFLFSGSFLSIFYVPGILAGGVWGLTSLKIADSRIPTLEPATPLADLRNLS
jgi:hypothetical protein